MKMTSVRDFKNKATQYLGNPEEIVVTRHGKPIAVLTHVKNDSPGALLLELRGLLKRSGVSKKEILSALEEARKEVYR
jgi:antitoxin (DNA-binding transcriptional repressor) of toxin-antitoxin stability system